MTIKWLFITLKYICCNLASFTYELATISKPQNQEYLYLASEKESSCPSREPRNRSQIRLAASFRRRNPTHLRHFALTIKGIERNWNFFLWRKGGNLSDWVSSLGCWEHGGIIRILDIIAPHWWASILVANGLLPDDSAISYVEFRRQKLKLLRFSVSRNVQIEWAIGSHLGAKSFMKGNRTCKLHR